MVTPPARKRLTLRDFPPSGWIFLGVFLLRLLVLVRLTDSQFLLPTAGDMQFYNNWALRIVHGDWTTHTAFYGLPLYAYLLAAIYKVCGYSPFVPGLIQAALEGGTAVLLYKLGSTVSWQERRRRRRSVRCEAVRLSGCSRQSAGGFSNQRKPTRSS